LSEKQTDRFLSRRKEFHMPASELSGFIAGGIVLTAIVVAVAIVSGIMGLARRPGLFADGPGDPDGAARIARIDRWAIALVAGAAVAAVLVTSLLGGRSPIVGLVYVFGLGIAAYALVVRTETGRRLLDAVPQEWLIAGQAYRVVGGAFLGVATYDVLPAYFAIPAGSGDFITGIVALLVAVWWVTGAPIARPAAWLWNIFGLLDLVVAVGIGLGLFAAPAAALFGGSAPWLERAALGFQPFGATIFPLGSPLALVPTFLVPLAIFLHLLSLRKLALGAAPRHRMDAAGTGEASLSQLGSTAT
jgi:hypothetical protein